ncbi:MAG: type II secretion system GspH family protein [Deferribacteraceae bacterium]|jgi:prepilin-type N-terminal cleavage/methylation domain-containing protein|nr:type II secretion system GspH family protein [Deferribacteraceae bacterium]
MKSRGMTVIEMSITLVVIGIIVNFAVSFFMPVMKYKRYLSEQREQDLSVLKVIEYVKKKRYALPSANNWQINNHGSIYKTGHAGANVCTLPAAENAFIIETGAISPAVMTVAEVQALSDCPAPRILPGRFLPTISRTAETVIKFVSSDESKVYWCVTAPKQMSGAYFKGEKDAAFITAEGDAGSSDCKYNSGFKSVVYGENMLLTVPEKTIPAGVYYLNIFISATSDMAGRLDARQYALVVNP